MPPDFLSKSLSPADSSLVNRPETAESSFESILRSVWTRAIVLVVLTIVAYLPALHGGFLWDDDMYVSKNVLLTAPDGLRRIWFSFDSPSQYFPLTYTTFRIERALWDLDTFGYHLVNLLLHIANALLVWRLLVRLKIPGAWLAAGIFALHPVQVESVAWITERKNVLMGVFFLGALHAWLTFVEGRTKNRQRFYVLALVLCAFALFAKATACTLPAALLLILWLQKKPITRERIIQVIPFAGLSLLMGLVVVWWERYHQGTRGGQFALGLLERALIVGRGVWFYAGKLIWPTDLTFMYPRWNPMAGNPLAYAWLVGAIAVGVAIYLARRYAGRGVEVGFAFYVSTLSPVLGFVMLYTFRYTFVADHYQYLASIGLIALAAAGLTKLAGKFGIGAPIASGAAVLLLFLLGALTWRQANAYQNVETLWHDTLAKNPGSWMAYNNLGLTYYEDGRVDEAIGQYEKSLGLDPSNAEALNNLGNALRKKGKLDEAIVRYQKALEIKPDFAEADNNLGNALLQKGDVDQAIAYYEKAAKIRPDFATFQWNLGKALFTKRKYQESIPPFEAALRVTPNSAEAHGNLATSLMAVQRNDEAIQHFREALRLKSNYVQAHYFLGCLLAERGQRDEGVAHLKMVLRLQPSHTDARQQLSLLGVEPAK